METQSYKEIPGWGVDLDHANRPAYPKERIPPRNIGVHWEQPEQQVQKVRILRSIERPQITPVFGTTLPPSGLSGRIREIAFKMSENDIRHWLLLLFADRVNVVEGIMEDLQQGHIPNIFAEMGLKSELKYNKRGFARKVLISTAVFSLGFYILRWARTRQRA